jgi:rare lipoprotein A
MQWKNNLVLTGVPVLVLVSCGIFMGDVGEAQIRDVSKPQSPTAQLETTKLGGADDGAPQPALRGEKINYDEVGYASWYGDELRGKATASGEPFNPDAISAAHPTLQLPSFAEVTNLDSGRTILVRINDRGPSKRDRIIDISSGAAKQLGVTAKGQFPVRVRRVNPPEFERRQLQSGAQAKERLATPPALLAALRRNLKPGEGNPTTEGMSNKAIALAAPAAPMTVAQSVANSAGAQFDPPEAPSAKATRKPPAVVLPKPTLSNKMAPASTIAADYFVQLGAFSTKARAEDFAKKAGANVILAGNVWRVRLGPYETEESARAALGQLGAKGYRDARVTR